MEHFFVPPGWWDILAEQLHAARQIAPDVEHDEKEKYGRCDLYLTSVLLGGSPDELIEIQERVTELSLQTCSLCGQPGRLRKLQTLCDRCAGLDRAGRRAVAEKTARCYTHIESIR